MHNTTKHTPGPITDNLAHDIGEFLLDRHDQFTHWCEDQYAYIETDIQTIVPKLKAAPAMYAIIKDMREAFYVKGTRKALLEVMERSKNVLAQAEGQHHE